MPLTSLSGLRPPVRLPRALRHVRRPQRRGMRWLAAVWLGLLLGGISMAAWAGVADRFPGDLAVMRWIQREDPLGTAVMAFGRDIGSPTAVSVVLLLAAGVYARQRQRRSAGVVLGFWSGLVLQRVLKAIVGRPRPSPDLVIQRAGFTSSSFPSGHVMSSLIGYALALYVIWRLPLPLSVRLALSVWPLGAILLEPWVAVSGGVHWPSDTLGGLVWGAVFLIPMFLILRAAERRDAARQNTVRSA